MHMTYNDDTFPTLMLTSGTVVIQGLLTIFFCHGLYIYTQPPVLLCVTEVPYLAHMTTTELNP